MNETSIYANLWEIAADEHLEKQSNTSLLRTINGFVKIGQEIPNRYLEELKRRGGYFDEKIGQHVIKEVPVQKKTKRIRKKV